VFILCLVCDQLYTIHQSRGKTRLAFSTSIVQRANGENVATAGVLWELSARSNQQTVRGCTFQQGVLDFAYLFFFSIFFSMRFGTSFPD
jgi:hypothetical protein